MTRIDPNLTTALMGRKGVFVSAPATKVGIFGITDETGPTTLLGLSEVLEGGVFPGSTPAAPWPRASFSGLFNSSVPVPTRFLPTPSPNFLPELFRCEGRRRRPSLGSPQGPGEAKQLGLISWDLADLNAAGPTMWSIAQRVPVHISLSLLAAHLT